MCLLSSICFIFRIIPCAFFHLSLIVIILYIYSSYTITIVKKFFRTEIFKPQLFSSHATCLTFWTPGACSILLFISYGKRSDECSIWRKIIFFLRILYKCKQVACNAVVACLFVYPLFYTALCCCLFTSYSLFFILMLLLVLYIFMPLIFIQMLLLYVCLFVDHIYKRIIFVSVTYVYHFKNIISI